jgi:TPR repeat protein
MRIPSAISFAALAAMMALAPAAIGAEDPPSYASATEAYRQGAAAMKSGQIEKALPALSYAAERGVLGAELKLARFYARGDGGARDEGKAFTYYQRIADQHAEIAPSSPVAKFVAEAFVALGQYYRKGVPGIGLKSDPARVISAMPTRNMSSLVFISLVRACKRIRASRPIGWQPRQRNRTRRRKPSLASCFGMATASARVRVRA